MPRREVERVEVVAGRLDLAAVDDLVAEAEEDVLDLAPDLRRGMERAAPPQRGRAARSSSAGSVTSTRSAVSRVELARSSSSWRAATACSIASRAALSAIPVSRSRTSRSASFERALAAEVPDARLVELGHRRAAATAASASCWSASASTAATVSLPHDPL